MSDLIKADQSLLLVVSRFGLSLGFADKTVRQVCEQKEIDCKTFLAVVTFLSDANYEVKDSYDHISVLDVIGYLRNAHTYFLEFKLPGIRERLQAAVKDTQAAAIPYNEVFLRFFDEYFAEVRKHMDYENKVVFPYVEQLLQGVKDPRYSIAVFLKRHNEIDSKLEELKNILVKYFPAENSNYLLTDVLFEILSCESDLASHNRVEDFLFVPAVESVERKYTELR